LVSGGGIDVTSSAAYRNTIVAGNTSQDCGGGGGTLTSNGNNLVGAGTGCTATGADLVTSNVADELDTTLRRSAP
jgi:hypothetical protein